MDMDKDVTAEIKKVLKKISPSLGEAEVKLQEITEGTVVVTYQKALTNPSCHTMKTQMTGDVVAELLEEELRAIVPGFEKVVVVED